MADVVSLSMKLAWYFLPSHVVFKDFLLFVCGQQFFCCLLPAFFGGFAGGQVVLMSWVIRCSSLAWFVLHVGGVVERLLGCGNVKATAPCLDGQSRNVLTESGGYVLTPAIPGIRS